MRRFNGLLHSIDDIPSVEYPDGRREWHSNGTRHREGDKPAIEQLDGLKIWCLHGGVHRTNDLPAIIRADGSREWYLENRLHRDGDMPAIESADGSRAWYSNGGFIRRIRVNEGGIQYWPNQKDQPEQSLTKSATGIEPPSGQMTPPTMTPLSTTTTKFKELETKVVELTAQLARVKTLLAIKTGLDRALVVSDEGLAELAAEMAKAQNYRERLGAENKATKSEIDELLSRY